MGEIEELCDYIYIMSDGVLIKKGTVRELTAETFNRKNYVLKLDKHSREITEYICDKLKAVDVTVEVKDENDTIYINSRENISMELSKACTELGLYIREMYEKEPQLEDAIIRLSKEAHHEAVY